MEKNFSVLQKYVNSSARLFSPLQKTIKRVVNFDCDGAEVITFVPEDGADIIRSNGSFISWSLNSLVSAGINPNFAIHTGFSTRMEGLSSIAGLLSDLDSVLPSETSVSDKS